VLDRRLLHVADAAMSLEAKPVVTKKKSTRRKKEHLSMRMYVKKLAKESSDSKLQISAGAAEKLELLCNYLLEKFAHKAGAVMEMKKSRTLTSSCVRAAVNLELHPALAKRCDASATEAVKKLSLK
jgi:histone H3/H4